MTSLDVENGYIRLPVQFASNSVDHLTYLENFRFLTFGDLETSLETRFIRFLIDNDLYDRILVSFGRL